MSRPLIYLTNAASLRSKKHTGNGRIWAAMAKPPSWVLSSCAGTFPGGAPVREELNQVQAGTMDINAYLYVCTARFEERGRCGIYRPGRMRGLVNGCWEPIQDGDTLVCTCPRKGSPKRTHGCHIECLATVLTAKECGWNVVLYGEIL